MRTPEEIQAEIDKLYKEKEAAVEAAIPKEVDSPNTLKLREQLRNYIERIANGYSTGDMEHYIFEAAVEAFYGKESWDWINRNEID